MYVGEKPWHGLGIQLNEPPTIEDAIVQGGLDWDVVRMPLVIEGTSVKVPAFANVRSTDNSILGVVGSTYRPLQNKDAFSWFQPYLESGEITLETAGSLKNGRHVWILARIKQDPIEIVKNDPVLSYVLLSNSHDGTRTVRAGMTAIRTVCANTLAAAHSDKASKLLKVRHTDNTVLALDKVREALDLINREFRATTDGMKQMARRGVTIDTLKKYIQLVFEPKETVEDEEEINLKMERQAARIIPLFERGRGNDMPGVKGTMWAAYNSVTEYLTWERGRNADNRLENLWLGNAAHVAQKAYDVALKMAA